ncbi:MAG: spore protease YyaC [Clostridia bacterium]|nr:spore protease YyaC [Clostridia bacterium]
MNQFVYNYNTSNASDGISEGLKLIYNTKYPVIICVGSDLAVGDTLGPLIGSILKDKLQGKAYVYGSLECPITAKEINVIYNTAKLLHPKSKLLVIDAAVGDKNDVGRIKLSDYGIKPGKGIQKDLALIGDVSIIGIISDKNNSKYTIFNETRFSLVKKISDVIVDGILKYFR